MSQPACRHHDRKTWKLRADKHKRPGWKAAYCSACGRFLGCVPPKAVANQKKTA